ncbi:10928_t:CDS:1, partial [Acaulospora colombiana]
IPFISEDNRPKLTLKANVAVTTIEEIQGPADPLSQDRKKIQEIIKLSVAEDEKFQVDGNVERVERGISQLELALGMCEKTDPDLPIVLCNLGLLMTRRFT